MSKKIDEMKQLVEDLVKASNAYYNSGNPIMSDREFDEKIRQLEQLERETNIIFSNSPTQNVGAIVLGKLSKIKHEHKPMLSLEKVHSAKEIIDFADNKPLTAMIKLDGLSVRLTYENGKLVRGETRGNGIEGSDITEHVKQFTNVPLTIAKEDTYVVDGEAIITEEDFLAINAALPEGGEQYKNSRNLASGTLSLLDTALVKERKLRFVLWDVIKGEANNSFVESLNLAESLGFTVVPYQFVEDTLNEDLLDFYNDRILDRAKELGYPCDGVVWKFDDIAYGETKGQTSHHFCNAVAYKFKDETYETTLKEIQWTMGKTGTLTPVAIFQPVEIDGTTVERASVHNVSILTQLDLRPGDTITVYKANQIIPQIDKNLSEPYHVSSYLELPGCCPICGGITEVRRDNSADVLMCTNEDCQGKLLGKLAHAVSKNALNIEGLSEATLEFLIEQGWVKSLRDLFKLEPYKTEWAHHPGFGKKSVMKLFEQLEEKRSTNLERFLYAQSIPLIGRTASKQISQFCNGDIEIFCDIMSNREAHMFLMIDGFGKTMCDSLVAWMDKHFREFFELKEEFKFIVETNENKNSSVDLSGKTFVITGALNHYSNRDELKTQLENMGAKVSGSVSKNTFALICNEDAGSSKSKKATELGVQVWTEEQLLAYIN